MVKLPPVATFPVLFGGPFRWKRLPRTRKAWRHVLAIAVLYLAVLGAPATSQAAVQCLSAKETREAVAQKLVISPAAALRAARASTGGGQAVLARLCRREVGFIYQFAILRPDGKVVRLTLDAVTGRVMRRREQAGQKKSARPVNEHLPDVEAPTESASGKANL